MDINLSHSSTLISVLHHLYKKLFSFFPVSTILFPVAHKKEAEGQHPCKKVPSVSPQKADGCCGPSACNDTHEEFIRQELVDPDSTNKTRQAVRLSQPALLQVSEGLSSEISVPAAIPGDAVIHPDCCSKGILLLSRCGVVVHRAEAILIDRNAIGICGIPADSLIGPSLTAFLLTVPAWSKGPH